MPGEDSLVRFCLHDPNLRAASILLTARHDLVAACASLLPLPPTVQPSAALAAVRAAKGLAVKDQLAAAAAQQARDQKFSLEIDWIKAVPGE